MLAATLPPFPGCPRRRCLKRFQRALGVFGPSEATVGLRELISTRIIQKRTHDRTLEPAQADVGSPELHERLVRAFFIDGRTLPLKTSSERCSDFVKCST